MSLITLPKVETLQQALHDKAKRSPNFRFYSLYDKVSRTDVLWVAFQRCRANGGAAGVDGQTFEDIAEYGERQWLDELAEARPMPAWIAMFAIGSVSGCVPSTRCRVRELHVSLMSACTKSWG